MAAAQVLPRLGPPALLLFAGIASGHRYPETWGKLIFAFTLLDWCAACFSVSSVSFLSLLSVGVTGEAAS